MKPNPQYLRYVDHEIPAGELEKARPVAIAGLPTGGGGDSGGPVQLDSENMVIARGVMEIAPGATYPVELFLSNEGTVLIRINAGTEVDPNWVTTDPPYIPRVTDSSTVISAHYGVDNVMAPAGSVAGSTISLGRDLLLASMYDASSGSRKNASMQIYRGSHLVTAGVRGQDQVKMESQSDGTFSVSSGEHETTSSADRVDVLRLSLGRVEGNLELRAGHYKDRLAGEPEPQGPYMAAVDDGIITLAALRKYVEDTIGYGDPGQVLATNSTGDGYEWVDPQ